VKCCVYYFFGQRTKELHDKQKYKHKTKVVTKNTEKLQYANVERFTCLMREA